MDFHYYPKFFGVTYCVLHIEIRILMVNITSGLVVVQIIQISRFRDVHSVNVFVTIHILQIEVNPKFITILSVPGALEKYVVTSDRHVFTVLN